MATILIVAAFNSARKFAMFAMLFRHFLAPKRTPPIGGVSVSYLWLYALALALASGSLAGVVRVTGVAGSAIRRKCAKESDSDGSTKGSA